jgi:hypothetical protein
VELPNEFWKIKVGVIFGKKNSAVKQVKLPNSIELNTHKKIEPIKIQSNDIVGFNGTIKKQNVINSPIKLMIYFFIALILLSMFLHYLVLHLLFLLV